MGDEASDHGYPIWLVRRKVKQLFLKYDLVEVWAVLSRYGGEPHHRERNRVHLAILRLSGGDLNKLQEYVGAACTDYRDVLARAEYPREMRLRHSAPGEAYEEARRADRADYLDWLRGDGSGGQS